MTVTGPSSGLTDEEFVAAIKNEDALDPSTTEQNFLGLTCPGPNNPKTYGGEYSYSYVPKTLAEYPAIRHDRRYDDLGVAGASGLFTDSRAIGADWRFVSQELKIVFSNRLVTPKAKVQAAILGIGLGLASLPKTLTHLTNMNSGGSGSILLWDDIASRDVTNIPNP